MTATETAPDYRAIQGTRGVRYLKNGKLVGKDKIPAEVLARITPKVIKKLELTPKQCIFCKSFGNKQRMVNLQTIYLCDNDYYDANIGKIAQQLRKLQEQLDERETDEESKKGREPKIDEGVLDEN